MRLELIAEYIKDNEKRYNRDHKAYLEMRKRSGPNKSEIKPCINLMKLFKSIQIKKVYTPESSKSDKGWQDPDKPDNDGKAYITQNWDIRGRIYS